MALQISTNIEINSSSEEVWKVLMDFSSYPEWNSFINSLEGEARVSKKIRANIDGMKFKPKVLVLDVNRKFQWIGHLLIPGLFDGKHSFELIENEDHSTTFIQKEIFKGVLVPFFKKKLKTDIKEKFGRMNLELKKRVEK